jgi:hypothetical protein
MRFRIAVAAALGCALAVTLMPPAALAGNQLYFSGTVGAGSRKWTQNSNGTLQWALRDWGSIYHNGGSWGNGFRNYQSGSDAFQGSTGGSPVWWANPWSNKTAATNCTNYNAVNVIANCWTTHPAY